MCVDSKPGGQRSYEWRPRSLGMGSAAIINRGCAVARGRGAGREGGGEGRETGGSTSAAAMQRQLVDVVGSFAP